MRTSPYLFLLLGFQSFASLYCVDAFASESSSKEIIAIKSGSWSDAAVWNCAWVPGPKDDVIIGGNHWLSLNQHAEVRHLTIQHDGGLEFSWQSVVTLSISGDLTCEGFMDPGIGRVLFNSNGKQSVKGYVDMFHLHSSGRKSLSIEGYVNVFHGIKVEKSKVISNNGLHLWPLNPAYKGVQLTDGGKLTGIVMVHGVLGIIQKTIANEAPVQNFLAYSEHKKSLDLVGFLPVIRNKGYKINKENQVFLTEKRPVQTFKLVDCPPLHERIFDRNQMTGKVENYRPNRN